MSEKFRVYVPAHVVLEIDYDAVRSIEASDFDEFDDKMMLVIADHISAYKADETFIDHVVDVQSFVYKDFIYEYYPVNRPEESV